MKGLLLIIDGMGISSTVAGNAVTSETMPFLFGWMDRRGVAALEASGVAVGLASGQAGNSEIGHLTIGAGQRLPSTLEKIRMAHADGSWGAHPLWTELVPLEKGGGRIHVVGLLSDAGVHGHGWSLARSAELASKHGASDVVVHPILDGVDAAAGSAPGLLRALEGEVRSVPSTRIGCVVGRKGACDRSGNLALTRGLVRALQGREEAPPFSWDVLAEHLSRETEASFPCHAHGGGPFLRPGERVISTNHRADRTTQLARVLAEDHPVFSLVELGDAVKRERVFFPTRAIERGLGSVLREAKIRSIRIAEACKFPHVTTFLDGFREGEVDRAVSIPSIAEADIAGHPEMSLSGVVEAILAAIGETDDSAIVANIANLDQVGHLGKIALAALAARHVDDALRTLHAACRDRGCPLVVTSDHGNADAMLDPSGRPLGSHSTNPVPLVVDVDRPGRLRRRSGSLANVAASFLQVIGLPSPAWMEPGLWQHGEA